MATSATGSRVHGAHYLSELVDERPGIAKLSRIYERHSRLVQVAHRVEIRALHDFASDFAPPRTATSGAGGLPDSRECNQMILS